MSLFRHLSRDPKVFGAQGNIQPMNEEHPYRHQDERPRLTGRDYSLSVFTGSVIGSVEMR